MEAIFWDEVAEEVIEEDIISCLLEAAVAILEDDAIVADVLISEAAREALATISDCQFEALAADAAVASPLANDEAREYLSRSCVDSYLRPVIHFCAKRSSKVNAPGVSPREPLSVSMYDAKGA